MLLQVRKLVMFDKHHLLSLKSTFILSLLTICFSISAQNTRRLDSLKNLLTNSDISSRIDLLRSIAIQYGDFDNLTSLKFLDDASILAAVSGDSLRIATVGRTKAQILRRLSRFEAAVKELNCVIPIAERNHYTSELAQMFNGLAIDHTYLANYERALYYNLQSLLIREKEGDKAAVSSTLLNIGLFYYKIKNYQKALEFYERSLKMKIESNDKSDADQLMVNIGMCYCYLNRLMEARAFITKGIELCKNDCRNSVLISAEYGYGISSFFEGKIDDARENFRKSLHRSEEDHNQQFQSDNLFYLGKIESECGNYTQAEKLFKKSESLAIKGRYRLLVMQNFYELAKTYQEWNHPQQHAKYMEKYSLIRDSITNEGVFNKIMVMQASFDQKQNLQVISTNEDAISKQHSQIIILSALFALISLLAMILIGKVHKKQKDNNLLNIKVKERTYDLKAIENQIRNEDSTSSALLSKTIQDIRSRVITMKGLYHAASLDNAWHNSKAYLSKAKAEVDNLGGLIEKLNFIREIRSTRNFESIDLNELVHKFVNNEAKQIPSIDFVVDDQVPVKVISDPKVILALLDCLVKEFGSYLSNSKICFRIEKINGVASLSLGGGLNGKHKKNFFMTERITEIMKWEFRVQLNDPDFQVTIGFEMNAEV